MIDFEKHIQREFEKAIYTAMGIPPALLENKESSTFGANMIAQEQYSTTIIQELERIQRRLDEITSKMPKFIVPEQMARLFKEMLDNQGLTYRHEKRGIFKIFNRYGMCAWMYIVHEKHDRIIVVDKYGNQ